MLFLLFGSMFFVIPTLVFGELFYMGTMFVAMGAVVIIFPFGTEDSVRLWGLRKTVRYIRMIGMVMVLAGMCMMLALWPF